MLLQMQRTKNQSYRQAEEHYGVPEAVIYNKIGGKNTPMSVTGASRFQVLPPEVENQNVKCWLARSKMGLPCDKLELRQLVGEYVKAKDLKTPFKDGIPGEDWYYAFMTRNPSLNSLDVEDSRKKNVLNFLAPHGRSQC